MKKFLLCSWILLFLFKPYVSQSNLEQEMNEQVWKPFIKSLNSGR
jgi:hypothetical protein